MPIVENLLLIARALEPDDHTSGPRDACVAVIEYGSYDSAACREAHGAIGRITERHEGRVSFTFRHFAPADQNPSGWRAAEAAEAACAQGRFWDMHALLFEHQDALDYADLLEYALTLGLDASRFLRDLASHIGACRVEHHICSALQRGVSGTPTFFINGTRLCGEWSEDGLVGAIERAIGNTA